MAILHKNISAEGDIHNPKWFSGANNGDVAWRNELGVLESTDELVLPAALDFVDGSAAPPTSNSGDIYVLSSGASVNAGWGTVSLGDWVRYDGTTWNVITPQKSSLCYNETTDALNSYDGSTWSAIGSGGGGGNTIYTADGILTGDRTVSLDGNDLSFDASSGYLATPFEFKGYPLGGSGTNPYLRIKGYGEVEILGTSNNLLTVKNGAGSAILDVNNGTAKINGSLLVSSSFFKVETTSKAMNFYQNGGSSLVHDIQTGIGFPDKVRFNILGGTSQFIVGSNAVIGSENISLQGSTLIKGNGTSTGSALSIYNNDTTPIKLWDFLDNGTLSKGDTLLNIGNNNSITGAITTYAIGWDNNISGGTFGKLAIGDANSVNGNNAYTVGRLNVISANNVFQFGNFLQSGVRGAFIIGHGVYSDGAQKLVNNTPSSLALGWNTTTPQHLFKSDGVNLTLPTSATGLSSGDLWNDGGTVKIV